MPTPIVSSWLISDEKIHSNIFSKIRSNEDEWKQKLWSNIEKINTTKSKDWEIEKESRLIIPLGMSCGGYDAEDKLVKYDFNQLTGIIFGINMIESHKEKIISIVKDHCKNHERMSFDFFQAYFCKRNNCVEKTRLDIDMTF